MKKILAIILVLCLLLAIAACKRDDEEGIDVDNESVETTEAADDGGDDGDGDGDDNAETTEVLAGGMTVKEPTGGYGEAIYPTAD